VLELTQPGDTAQLACCASAKQATSAAATSLGLTIAGKAEGAGCVVRLPDCGCSGKRERTS